jgi:serine/threonine-protein kinase
MVDRSLVQRLLERLQESDRSIEEVCAEHPDLLPEVRRQWRLLQDVQADLDALFPMSGPVDVEPAASQGSVLPQVPGYVVEQELGRGGMGVVYRAFQVRLQRRVALKMMLTGPLASRQEVLRFQREAELVAQLRHPNIVPIYEVGDVGGQPYYTMELIDGPTLAQKLHSGPMPPPTAAELVATLAAAAEFAHQHGIVHRDLKPANILFAADGSPRISDFGLARRVGGSAFTMSGAQVGTPSYMAPEQAAGRTGVIGPASDIHALGAILYALLTGVAPFRADTPVETTRQVIEVEPTRPSRLNPRVPRDLETICLQCLRKEPHRRYASAALLAADLQRFTRGEPVAARRIIAIERLWKWMRRRPALAAATGGSAVLAMTLLGQAIWLSTQRAQLLQSVEGELARVRQCERAGEWTQARAALARAQARLGDRGPADLQQRLGEAGRDLDLVAHLERIRLQQSLTLRKRRLVRLHCDTADADYTASLSAFGLACRQSDPGIVAARVQSADICAALTAALDDWAMQLTGADATARREWLLDVARRADPAGDSWRMRARNAATWTHVDELKDLATKADVGRQPISLLLSVADRLQAAGGDAVPFLERVLAEQPQDLWVTFALGLLCSNGRPDESIRYFQAAVALRPDAAETQANLGVALAANGRLADAEPHMRRAIQLDDQRAIAWDNLAHCLYLMGRHEEAAATVRQAIQLSPRSGPLHAKLGAVLFALGRKDEAFEQFGAAAAIDADDPDTQGGLGRLLLDKGDLEAAIEHFQHALRLDPDNPVYHQDLGRALQRSRRWDEAVEQCRLAVVLDPQTAERHTWLGEVLCDSGRMDEGIAECREAVRLDPARADSHCSLGVWLGTDWQVDAAVAAFTAALQLDGRLARAQGGLAQALMLQGSFEEAMAAARRYGEIAAPSSSAMATQILRQGERLRAMQDRPPDRGSDGTEVIERADCIFLARHCARIGRFVDAVHWYERILTEDPARRDDLRSDPQYQAAIAALQAAGSADGALDETARLALRRQANAWLNGDLASRKARWSSADPRNRRVLRLYAGRWRADPDLAAVRDAGRLFELSVDERQGWLAFWHDLESWLRETDEH